MPIRRHRGSCKKKKKKYTISELKVVKVRNRQLGSHHRYKLKIVPKRKKRRSYKTH